ncbi:hypothetical protein CYY_002156 [Polysphondylium violaceum]|uniref:Calreticulin n=1 Tax=Polysphondylium violaceum TaxID=133409 RepID=A0A8J4Q1S7_9MYCE|nr:hypothetical protein CYY_002156 [Polysphondylium violaceum]
MRSVTSFLLLVLLLVGLASATIHFQETFEDGWKDKWVVSKWKQDEGTAGKFAHTAGKWYGDAENKGIQTSQDARFYAISAKFPAFSNEGKDLVVQYTVKNENKVDCGGSYIKLLPATVDQENFNGDSEYNIMFGPDVCGAQKRIHVIFNYKGKNYLIKKEINKVETDQLTHQYTLIVKPDNTYKVLVDNKEAQSGSLAEDWEMLAPKTIKDPNASKPEDWVNDKEIDDPEDVKPENYDDIPATIVDPDATKPDDWNEEDDGEWEAPVIANPEFKGAWKAKKIPNPAYKGEWVHPLVDNPEYQDDKNLYLYKNIGAVGFELWQVKSGSIFDNILIADSEEDATAFSEKNFESIQEGEKKMFEEIEEKRKAEEKQKLEDEKKKQEEAAAAEKEQHSDHEHSEADEEQELIKTQTGNKDEVKPPKAAKKVDHDEL